MAKLLILVFTYNIYALNFCEKALTFFRSNPQIQNYSESYHKLKDVSYKDHVLITKSKNNVIEAYVEGATTKTIRISVDSKIKEIKLKNIEEITILKKNTDESLKSKKFERVQKYFKQKDSELKTWTVLKDKKLEEIQLIKTLSKEEKIKKMLEASADLRALIKEKFGIDRIGYHFNLHGGAAIDYVNAGGIRVGVSDPAAQYGILDRNFDPRPKVFFFDSKYVDDYKVLNEANPANTFGGGRMGNILMLFDLNSSFIKKAESENGILSRNEISITYKPEWLKAQNEKNELQGSVGILAKDFLAYPFHVFEDTKKLLGLRKLSRDEETYAHILFLQEFFRSI